MSPESSEQVKVTDRDKPAIRTLSTWETEQGGLTMETLGYGGNGESEIEESHPSYVTSSQDLHDICFPHIIQMRSSPLPVI